MTIQPMQFAIPDGMVKEALCSKLEDKWRFDKEPQSQLDRTYYDSFDWRLHAAGYRIEAEPARPGHTVRLVSRETGAVLASQRLSPMPSFAWDLPDGALRNKLEPILEMRALLPTVTVRSQSTVWRLLDDEEKTVLRVAFEQNRVARPGTRKFKDLGRGLRLVPVTGYPKALKRVAQFLAEDVGLSRAEAGATSTD